MNIAVLLDHWHRHGGGLEQYLWSVLPALAQRGHSLLLVAAQADHGTPPGVRAHALTTGAFRPRPWADYQLARRAAEVAQEWGAEAVFSPRSIAFPGAVFQPMGGSAPEVQAARGRTPSFRTRALMRLEQATLEQAGVVFSPSPMVSREISARRPEVPIVEAPLPLLEEATALASPRPWSTVQPDAPLRLFHCGRDPWRHGSLQAVNWLRALRAAGVPATLDLWSKTTLHSARLLRKSEAELAQEGVRLHGWDGSFLDRLAEADLLLHPTRYDSFSLVCLEAAARGIPVLCSDRAGVAELLPQELVVALSSSASPAQEQLLDDGGGDGEALASIVQGLLQAGASEGEARWQARVRELRHRFRLQTHVDLLEDTLRQHPVPIGPFHS